MANKIGKFEIDNDENVTLNKKKCEKVTDKDEIKKELNKGIKDIEYDKFHVYFITGSGMVYIPGIGWVRVSDD